MVDKARRLMSRKNRLGGAYVGCMWLIGRTWCSMMLTICSGSGM